jgi:hypothetical protein
VYSPPPSPLDCFIEPACTLLTPCLQWLYVDRLRAGRAPRDAFSEAQDIWTACAHPNVVSDILNAKSIKQEVSGTAGGSATNGKQLGGASSHPPTPTSVMPPNPFDSAAVQQQRLSNNAATAAAAGAGLMGLGAGAGAGSLQGLQVSQSGLDYATAAALQEALQHTLEVPGLGGAANLGALQLAAAAANGGQGLAGLPGTLVPDAAGQLAAAAAAAAGNQLLSRFSVITDPNQPGAPPALLAHVGGADAASLLNGHLAAASGTAPAANFAGLAGVGAQITANLSNATGLLQVLRGAGAGALAPAQQQQQHLAIQLAQQQHQQQQASAAAAAAVAAGVDPNYVYQLLSHHSLVSSGAGGAGGVLSINPAASMAPGSSAVMPRQSSGAGAEAASASQHGVGAADAGEGDGVVSGVRGDGAHLASPSFAHNMVLWIRGFSSFHANVLGCSALRIKFDKILHVPCISCLRRWRCRGPAHVGWQGPSRGLSSCGCKHRRQRQGRAWGAGRSRGSTAAPTNCWV